MWLLLQAHLVQIDCVDYFHVVQLLHKKAQIVIYLPHACVPITQSWVNNPKSSEQTECTVSKIWSLLFFTNFQNFLCKFIMVSKRKSLFLFFCVLWESAFSQLWCNPHHILSRNLLLALLNYLQSGRQLNLEHSTAVRFFSDLFLLLLFNSFAFPFPILLCICFTCNP